MAKIIWQIYESQHRFDSYSFSINSASRKYFQLMIGGNSGFVGQSINMLSQFRNQVSMLKGKFKLFVYITFMAEKSRMKSRPMFYLLLFFKVKCLTL